MIKKIKKISYRTCIGCQEKKEKKELLRIIRTPEGNIEIDETGKKSGRGAYLCHNTHCLEEAIKKNRIEKALRITIEINIKNQLSQSFQEIIEQKFS